MTNNALFTLEDIAIKQPSYYAGLPKKGCLFRVHPERFVKAYVMLNDKQWYLFNSKLIDDIKKTMPFIPGMYHAHLYQAVDSYNDQLVVVISLGGVGDEYLKFVEMAKETWIERLNHDQVQFKPRPDYQKTPEWAVSFEELIISAFAGRYISDKQAPLIQQLLAGH